MHSAREAASSFLSLVGLASMPPKVYVDTCCVSASVSRDAGDEQEGVDWLFSEEAGERFELVRGPTVRGELARSGPNLSEGEKDLANALPEVYAPHARPRSRFIGNDPIFQPHSSPAPLLASLRAIFDGRGKGGKDESNDADHAFQAASCGCTYLVTFDRRFLGHHNAVRAECGLEIVSPTELRAKLG